jgi:hypothetical protein
MSLRSGALSPADTEELRAVLERELEHHFGPSGRIVALERRPLQYRSSYALDELHVRLEGGEALALIFKDLGPASLPESVRVVKPDFLVDPQREIEVYRRILQSRRLGTPTCYGAVADAQRSRYWLFLERVPGVPLWQVGELAVWRQAAAWLAAFHQRLEPQEELDETARQAHLLRYDADFYRLWLRRALAFAQQRVASERRRLEWLAGRYERVIERLLALPACIIHGEFYASHILVQENPATTRLAPVDWEMAALGPGLIDLAALIAGNWSEPEKLTMAAAYHEALCRVHPGHAPPAWNDFAEALLCCRLHLAVQWLGWSENWTPPPEHASNWLQEALDVAEWLEL